MEGVIYEGNDVHTGKLMTFVRTKEDFEKDFEVDADELNVCNNWSEMKGIERELMEK
jgi:hypothetical protein